MYKKEAEKKLKQILLKNSWHNLKKWIYFLLVKKGGKEMERIKKLSLKKINDSIFSSFTFVFKFFIGILSLKLIHIYLS